MSFTLKEFRFILGILLIKRRKKYLISYYENHLDIVNHKIRFITEIMSGTLNIFNKKKQEVIDQLRRKGYKSMEQMPVI